MTAYLLEFLIGSEFRIYLGFVNKLHCLRLVLLKVQLTSDHCEILVEVNLKIMVQVILKHLDKKLTTISCHHLTRFFWILIFLTCKFILLVHTKSSELIWPSFSNLFWAQTIFMHVWQCFDIDSFALEKRKKNKTQNNPNLNNDLFWFRKKIY